MSSADDDNKFTMNENGDLIYGVVSNDTSDNVFTLDMELLDELNLIEWDDDWNPQNLLDFGDSDPIMPQGYYEGDLGTEQHTFWGVAQRQEMVDRMTREIALREKFPEVEQAWQNYLEVVEKYSFWQNVTDSKDKD